MPSTLSPYSVNSDVALVPSRASGGNRLAVSTIEIIDFEYGLGSARWAWGSPAASRWRLSSA